jgi:3-methyl-2-oxobutanoate hydroxymethyltransferase
VAKRITVPQVAASKVARGSPPLVMLTAYDAPTARVADAAGVDIILVGDSLNQVVAGRSSTLTATVRQMAYHVEMVASVEPQALVVADMPWLSYHLSPAQAVRNAAVLIRAGAEAVKLEGGMKREPCVRALVDAEIPVMGHVGLTPQSVNVFGGYKVQGKGSEARIQLLQDAKCLARYCFSVVLEGVPRDLAAEVTRELPVPTIGIGAGPDCDGQVLVFHDVLGFSGGPYPKFVRRYEDLFSRAVDAIGRYAADVRERAFPSDEESYH